MMMRYRSLLSALLAVLLSTLDDAWASTTANGAVSAPISSSPSTGSSSGGNPIIQMAGYVKDSLVRTVEGCGQLWTNHKRCNQIREKQKEHKEKLQRQWEMEGRMDKDQVKERLKSVNGGISYAEYSFLIKGKEDRSKLMNMMFLMWGAPRFLPYALMFYPEMLPSPFSPLPSGSARESALEKLSRERSRAVIETLLNIERDSKVTPFISKLNIFGKKAQEKQLQFMETVGNLTSRALTTPGAQGSFGAQIVLGTLNENLYKSTEFTRAEMRLVGVPKTVMKGVAAAVEGPSPVNSFLPNFMTRGKVVGHLKKVTDADEFLVNEAVDLSTIESSHLVEACSERLIGGLGRSDEELRETLREWLDLAVVQPTARVQQTGQYYNANLARCALLCYHALDGTRDPRSASYLPRLLFQGQFLSLPMASGVDGKSRKKREEKSNRKEGNKK